MNGSANIIKQRFDIDHPGVRKDNQKVQYACVEYNTYEETLEHFGIDDAQFNFICCDASPNGCKKYNLIVEYKNKLDAKYTKFDLYKYLLKDLDGRCSVYDISEESFKILNIA